MLLVGQLCVGSQRVREVPTLSSAEALRREQQAKAENARQEALKTFEELGSSSGSDEEVDETMTIYLDGSRHSVIKPKKGNDSDDGSDDDEPQIQSKSVGKPVSNLRDIAKKGKLDISEPKMIAVRPRAQTAADQLRRAAELLGDDAITGDLSSVADKKSPRGSTDSKSPREDEKKSPRGTFGRKAAQIVAVKVNKKDKQSFNDKLDGATYCTKLEEAHFIALLEDAKRLGCLHMFADWCAKNPAKITILNFKTLLNSFIDSMLEGRVEKVSLDGAEKGTQEHEDSDQSEAPDSEKSETPKKKDKKKHSVIDFAEQLVPRSRKWKDILNAFEKILYWIDACGKKLATECEEVVWTKIEEFLQVAIPDDFKVDEHLCTALSYAVASFDKEAVEIELCEMLRRAAQESDGSYFGDELIPHLNYIVGYAETNLSGEELQYLQKIKAAYRGEFPPANLLISFVSQFSGQLEKELYDKLIRLGTKFDAEEDRPAYKETCLSLLARWALHHGNRLPRASKKAVSDLDRQASGNSGKSNKILERMHHNKEVSGKMNDGKLEFLRSINVLEEAPAPIRPDRPEVRRMSDEFAEPSSGSPSVTPQHERRAPKQQGTELTGSVASVRLAKTKANLPETEGRDGTNTPQAAFENQSGMALSLKAVGTGTGSMKNSPQGDRRAAPKKNTPESSPRPGFSSSLSSVESPQYGNEAKAGLQELTEGSDDTNQRLAKAAQGYQSGTGSAVKAIGRGTLKGSPQDDRRAAPKKDTPESSPRPGLSSSVSSVRSPRYGDEAKAGLQELTEGSDDTNQRLAKAAQGYQSGTGSAVKAIGRGTMKGSPQDDRKAAPKKDTPPSSPRPGLSSSVPSIRSPQYGDEAKAGLQELTEGSDDTNQRLAKAAEGYQSGTGSAVKAIGTGSMKNSPQGDRRAAPKKDTPESSPRPGLSSSVSSIRSPQYGDEVKAGLQELTEGSDDTNQRLAKAAEGYQSGTGSAIKAVGRGRGNTPQGDRRAAQTRQESAVAKPALSNSVRSLQSPQYGDEAKAGLKELAEGSDDTNQRLAKAAEGYQSGNASEVEKKKAGREKLRKNDSNNHAIRFGSSALESDEDTDTDIRFEPIDETFEFAVKPYSGTKIDRRQPKVSQSQDKRQEDDDPFALTEEEVYNISGSKAGRNGAPPKKPLPSPRAGTAAPKARVLIKSMPVDDDTLEGACIDEEGEF